MQKNLWFLLFFTIFFPYIGFFPGIDVQPHFAFAGTICLLLCLKNVKYSFVSFLFIVLFFGLYLSAFLVHVDNLDAQYVVKQCYFVYSIFLMVFLAKHQRFVISSNTLYLFAGIYIFVGIIQLFYPSFLSGLVTRSSEHIALLVETGRGVRSLASEPAAFGKQLLSINVLAVVLAIKENKSISYCIKITTVLFFFNAILARSAYALAIHGALLLCLVSIFRLSLGVISVCFSLLVGTFFWVHYGIGGRVGWVIDAILSEPDLLLTQGAFRRVVNIPISIVSSWEFGYFGAGNSQDVFHSILQTPLGPLGFNVDNRALGGLIELYLSFGLLSIPVLCCYLIFLILLFKYKWNKLHIGVFFAIGSFFVIFQDGAVSNPTLLYVNFVLYTVLIRDKSNDY